MSLGIATSLLHNLEDNTPVELSQNSHRERKPLSPIKVDLRDSYGEKISKEEMEWLIK